MKTKVLIILFLIALVLNIVWEFSHVYLYLPTPSHPWTDRNLMLIGASLWDAGYVLIVFILMVLLNRNFYWFKKLNYKNISFISVLGLITAAWVEIRAIQLDKWAYGPHMPLVPVLGHEIGLTPLIQLVLTSILSFYILDILSREKQIRV